MHIIVPIIIIAIILTQIFFFYQNIKRMNQFSKIFAELKTWTLRKNRDTDFVDGVTGRGNEIFDAIISSINKYLGNNSGSVIDFGLLKDAVDRHCDSVESDIATQTPIPLYWGLAGTMGGVILGLYDLLDSDAILTLMGSSGGVINGAAENAAVGINSLLSGVAWAMGASICGIIFTTINSLLFKRCKLKEEDGKNSFLAWMQSELLPQLPSDTSDALNKLAKNLNKFNLTFANNVSQLGTTLDSVNTSYAIQADIIKAVHDMDVTKMSEANINVLKELSNCTDKLEDFNNYLSDVKGYTESIHSFESLFNKETERISILEDIRDFFRNYEGSISMVTANAGDAIKTSLGAIMESTTTNVNELNAQFAKQSEAFKDMIAQQTAAFEESSKEMKAKFSDQMAQMPQLAKQLEEIASIPARLDKLIDKVEKSNYRLAADINQSIKKAQQSSINMTNDDYDGIDDTYRTDFIPGWMKLTGWGALIIIAITCIFNIVIMFFPLQDKDSPTSQEQVVVPIEVVNTTDSVAPDSIVADSVPHS